MRYELLDADGNVINTILADEGFVSANYANYRLVEEQVAPPPHTPLSKLEFMNRFTDAELATIYSAAKQSVAVEIWLEKFKLASEIDLSDQRTIDGINALEASGLLAAGRAAEILACPR